MIIPILSIYFASFGLYAIIHFTFTNVETDDDIQNIMTRASVPIVNTIFVILTFFIIIYYWIRLCLNTLQK